MTFAELCFQIFTRGVYSYHLRDDVNTEMSNPYGVGSIEYQLFAKNWIDSVQWHLEDIIRDPQICASEALVIKRRIDVLNQRRTEVVERLDEYFFEKYRHVVPVAEARFNTESPAWAIDRLSILVLKIYHMELEVSREPEGEHGSRCLQKLNILKLQKENLVVAIDQLLGDIERGYVYMTIYKQMKMYNDPELNPVLYEKVSSDD